MKAEIKVPAMGESITEATIGNIIKPSGSNVKADDEILELETDKVNQVLYAPQTGTIQLNVTKDQVVKIGDVIGYVESEGAAKEEPAPKKAAEPPKPTPPKETKPKEQPERMPSLEPPTRSSQGAGARVTKESFLTEIKEEEEEPLPTIKTTPAASQAKVAPEKVSQDGRETRRKMTRIRRVIADRLVEAQQSTAMLTTFNEVDMTEIVHLREKYKESFTKEHGTRLGFMPFFIKATVSALQHFPDFNSYIDGDEIVHREYFDIGVAVGTDKGLFVPVVRNCDQLTFAEIESQIEALSKKAKEGTITVDDLQGAGFTITNGGVYGSLLSTPILNPPQSGILGMHKIMKRPVVIEDQIVARSMMYLALSYDHRIVDGKEAVSFLVHIKNLLEDPARHLLDV
jgi:2-oxoglutarate dehydrogenase E2 component (dihydrolipoamide succinyltransferase)